MRRSVALIFFFLFFISFSVAGQSDLRHDTSRIISLIDKAGKLTSNRPQQDSLIKEAISLAQQARRNDYVLRFYNYWSFLRMIQNEFREAADLSTKGINIALADKGLQNTVSFRDIVNHQSLCYFYLNKKDSALYWSAMGKRLSRQSGDDFNLVVALVSEAVNKAGTIPDEEVTQLYDSAIRIAATTPTLHDNVLAMYNKAYFLQDKKEKDWPGSVAAFTSLQDIIEDSSLYYSPYKVYERTPFWFRSARVSLYGSLANIYYVLSDLENASYYQQKAADIYIKEKNFTYLPFLWASVAEMEALRGNRKMVQHVYDSCLLLLKQYHKQDTPAISSFFFAAAWLQEQNGQLATAITTYQKAIAVTQPGYFHVAWIGLLRCLVASAQMKEALTTIQEIESRLSGKGMLFFESLFKKELSSYYRAKGDSGMALRMELDYFRLKDSLNTTSRYYLVKEVETKFKTGEKEKELRAAEEEKKLQAQLLKQSKRQIWLLGVGLAILALLAATLYKIYRDKKKQALLLAKKNEQVETLIRELHHRVKNNLQVVSSLLRLQSNRVEDDTARVALEQGKNRVDAMALIHQKLYMREANASVNMQEYLESLCHSLAGSYGYGTENVQVSTALHSGSLDIDKAIPLGLIVNELVTNAFKYAFEGHAHPLITVSLLQTEKIMELKVADNGKGIANINEVSNKKSFGMRLVHLLTGQLNGQLKMEQNGGSVFTLIFNSVK